MKKKQLLRIAFALVGVALGAGGVYAVTAYGVERRAPELGVRLALGAKPTQLVHSTVLRGMIPVIVGLVAGVTLALGLAGALSTLVYRVEPNDPGVLAAVAALMFLVSAAATYLLARRISRIDPAGSLREE